MLRRGARKEGQATICQFGHPGTDELAQKVSCAFYNSSSSSSFPFVLLDKRLLGLDNHPNTLVGPSPPPQIHVGLWGAPLVPCGRRWHQKGLPRGILHRRGRGPVQGEGSRADRKIGFHFLILIVIIAIARSVSGTTGHTACSSDSPSPSTSISPSASDCTSPLTAYSAAVIGRAIASGSRGNGTALVLAVVLLCLVSRGPAVSHVKEIVGESPAGDRIRWILEGRRRRRCAVQHDAGGICWCHHRPGRGRRRRARPPGGDTRRSRGCRG